MRELHSLVWCSSGKTKNESDPKDGQGAIRQECDGEYQRPTVRQDVFSATLGFLYRSSSSYLDFFSYGTWVVNFGDGVVLKYFSGATVVVRLVRASQ